MKFRIFASDLRKVGIFDAVDSEVNAAVDVVDSAVNAVDSEFDVVDFATLAMDN